MEKGGWRTGEGKCSQTHKQALRPMDSLRALGFGSQRHPSPQGRPGLGDELSTTEGGSSFSALHHSRRHILQGKEEA